MSISGLRVTKFADGLAHERSLFEFIRVGGNLSGDLHKATRGTEEGNAPLALASERRADAIGLVDDERGVGRAHDREN
jgi:hypothetical protein